MGSWGVEFGSGYWDSGVAVSAVDEVEFVVEEEGDGYCDV